MGIFSRHTNHEGEVVLILDIGSASVGGALVLMHTDAPPEILYTYRVPIIIPDTVDDKDFTQSMLRFLTQVVEHMSTQGVQHLNVRSLKKQDIEHAMCVFASPWFASETKVITLEKKHPIALSEKYVNELIEQEKDGFKKKLGITEDVVVIEQKIINTKLNGYITDNPYNKKAHTVELNTFLGVVPETIITNVEKAVKKFFHVRDIAHHSFSLVAYRTITDIFPDDSNSYIFDITGEVTDVTVVVDDVVTKTFSLPIGRNTIARYIAQQKNVSTDIALSLIHLYATEHAETKLYTEIDALIADVRTQWNDALHTEDFAPMGKTIFMTADTDAAPIFRKFLSTEAEKIVLLNAKHYNGMVVMGKNIREDMFLSTAAAFARRAYSQ